MSYEDLPCREAVALITDYLEGALPLPDRAVLERHLAWCEWCVTYFDQMRQAIALAGTFPEEEVAPAVLDAAAEAYRQLRQR